MEQDSTIKIAKAILQACCECLATKNLIAFSLLNRDDDIKKKFLSAYSYKELQSAINYLKANGFVTDHEFNIYIESAGIVFLDPAFEKIADDFLRVLNSTEDGKFPVDGKQKIFANFPGRDIQTDFEIVRQYLGEKRYISNSFPLDANLISITNEGKNYINSIDDQRW